MNRGMQCPCRDDNGVRCKNIMTKYEFAQDGFCGRCASLIWAFWREDTPVIFTDDQDEGATPDLKTGW